MNQLVKGGVTPPRNLTHQIKAFLDKKVVLVTVLEFYGVLNQERYGYSGRDVVLSAIRMQDIIKQMHLDITSEALVKLMPEVHGWERVAPTKRFGIHGRWWMRIDRSEEMVDEQDKPLGVIPINRFEPWPV